MRSRRHVPVCAVDIVGREAASLVRGAVPLLVALLQGRPEGDRAHQFQRLALRRRVEDAEGLDARVPAPLLELREHEVGVRLVVRGADLVGLGRELLQPGAHLGGVDRGVKGLLPLHLRVGGGCLEPKEPVLGPERNGNEGGRAGDGPARQKRRFHGAREAPAAPEGKRSARVRVCERHDPGAGFLRSPPPP